MIYAAGEQRSGKRSSHLIVFTITSKSESPMAAPNRRPSTLASGCYRGNGDGKDAREFESVIQGFVEDEIRARTCSSIGPDNVVIQCNWLLIGHNAPNLQSFNYVWQSCPSINGSSSCELSSSKQLLSK